ncbi:MFS transporter [Wolbachia endosymbiont of Howardula sp.]|uniref:MFS transporter n=1 Tax=Wolbachia endosymbiont of Howardula sp. TaxID=2916816 RepID=UPI00217F0FE2|nr:MFS transporter [Wolbachia endosymbiont of Howardula sp.]UWI83040.1 MFS transporter [Wolbachia endosymbiont of Howardula sp.]
MSDMQKAILSSIICNMMTSYELTLFIVLMHIISNIFFSSPSEYLNIIKFLGTFSIGFGFRPLGALIFGYMGDKYGRRQVLLISVLLVSISSSTVGIIPSYKEIGILSPTIFLICRIIQGISTGGETSINAAFLIEHSHHKKNLGFLGSIKPFSGALGAITCFMMIAICKKYTGMNYEIWGWRIPFYFCSVMGITGFFIRYIMGESIAYKKYKNIDKLVHTPFVELMKRYKKGFMIAIGIGIAQNAIVYSVIMFYNISVEEVVLAGINFKNIVRIISEIIFGCLAVFFGILSDRIGRKQVMIPILVVLACYSLPIFFLLSYNNYYIVTCSYLLMSIPIAASFGIYNSLICELFPTKVRCTGFSLAHNISAGIVGGISPTICMFLIEKTKTTFAAGIYLAICTLVSLTSLYYMTVQDKKVDW